ncbi:Predicted flavoprotein CzcO associated with the cation diffusion facilitator CzcD [Micromonospora purpureochromogenes]|uniref:Predicted flavoprotein CzcO associated with the cation diffusion facilitator CzcD n=1 Tax=Micromonospora purpureochromogenes TaxID=47872 RepID=A0A1C4YSS7_9ACTN|nr:NAD(P)-binding domain-containing protein [Micromonospora purpureochromogenes]SCF23720.1 Predicted flavoprotein CzcO associated with the cation diffusion facilitator CzcD [Micromonospora purpureochromogenes]
MGAPPSVAVIGAGAAGLATLKALADAGVPAVCFEAGDRVGGLWVYGSPGSPAYRTLHLNTSRRRTEFADHPMPAHWPDYPDHTRVAGWLADYADRFGLHESVRLRHTVDRVVPQAGDRWTVHADGSDGPVSVSVAAVVVANGHNRVPKSPVPPPPGTCTARQLHSHGYRGPEQLAGRRVLVVGGGNSAMDIAVDASYAGARTLLSLRRGVWVVPKHLLGRPSDTLNGALARRLPWRLRQRISQTMLTATVGPPTRYGLPAPAHGFLQDHPTLSDGLLSRLTHGEIEVRPGIAGFDGDRVTFTDGRADEVDLVIWCTGYRVDLPFLDPALLGDRPDALPLYRHVFHPDVPGLAFVGLMQSTGAAFPLVEAQARLVAAQLAGTYALPDPARQHADIRAELRAAIDRWGDRRPAMRVDFDAYLAQLARELDEGVRRAAATTRVPA